MPARSSFDYAIIQVVPHVERGECINAGVVVYCRTLSFLGARIELGRERLVALAPDADLAAIETHLEVIPRICEGGSAAGPIGQLSQSERFHWLVAPRSTVVQPSAVHSGLCDEPAAALEHLVATIVRVPGAAARQERYAAALAALRQALAPHRRIGEMRQDVARALRLLAHDGAGGEDEAAARQG